MSDKTERKCGGWAQGKGTSPNATPIPMLDTPNFDLGDERLTLEQHIENINLTEEMRRVRHLIVNQKTTIICDLDGTIANLQHRLHFIKNPDGTKRKKPDWDSFHKACVDDEPYDDVIEILHSLVLGMGNGCNVCGAVEREVYFFSGRNETVRQETVEWIAKNVSDDVVADCDYLLMRSEGDRRPDTVVKLEMAEHAGLTPDDVLCILDDRQSVVDMWRENGFRVMQIDAWKE